MPPPPLSFDARVIRGSQRGRQIGSPTLNLDLRDLPSALEEGIYACTATFDGQLHNAVLFYGPRPVFQDTIACEVHVIDAHIPSPPNSLHVTLVAHIRGVMDFPHPDELKRKIAEDISAARGILQRHRVTP